MKKTYVIILAAGSSTRFGGEIPKQFSKLAGKLVIEHTIDIFENHPLIDEIIVVVNPQFRFYVEEIVTKNNFRKVKKILNGGKTRQESSKIGVFSIDDDDDAYVLIHDAVRPFVSDKTISEVIRMLHEYESVDVAIDATDTVIMRDETGTVVRDIPDRSKLMLGQTPQGFRLSVIQEAYKRFEENPLKVTDDCGLVVGYGLGRVGIVKGERFNIKITYPEDLYLADKIFQVRRYLLTQDLSHFDSLSEKVICVFGGTSGIGKSIVEAAKSYGAHAYGFSRRTGVDVKNAESVRKALEEVHNKHGQIHYVVNTAAIMNLGTIEAREYDSIKEEIEINYFGSVVIAKESYRFLRETKGMLLLFASSSYTRGRELYSIYSSTKAAIVNFAQALANEWSATGIRVNVINPERTDTELRRKNFGYEDSSLLLSPEYVAHISLSVLLSHLNGQVIDVRKHDCTEGLDFSV